MSEAQRFGRYRVIGTLGAGAMGEVYAAVDDVLGREVAVKTLLGSAASRSADDRFRNEARAIAKLSHPGVVQLFDIDLDAKPAYLVMERVAGPSLKERLAEGPLPVAEVRALGIQIARALAAAHALKVVHRDVKPANILRAADGVWKLADFGVAHVPDSGMTMTGQFLGSPAYASPEALVKGLCDPEGDVFGLGATLYHAAAGRWPRMDATTSGLLGPVPSLGTVAPEIPIEVAAIIDAAVDIDAARRPSANKLADALAVASGIDHALQAPMRTPVAAAIPATPNARAAPTSVATVTVSSLISPAPIALAPGTGAQTRKRLMVGGAVLAGLIVIAFIASRAGSSHSRVPTTGSAAVPGTTDPTYPTDPDTEQPTQPTEQPTHITVRPPPMSSEKAAKDWNKILDQLARGNFREARKKLDEWERKHADGPTPETADLRRQLDAFPDQGPPGPPGHDDDDD